MSGLIGGVGNEEGGGRSRGVSYSGGLILVVVIVAMSAVVGLVLP